MTLESVLARSNELEGALMSLLGADDFMLYDSSGKSQRYPNTFLTPVRQSLSVTRTVKVNL